jgi:Ribonuclease G/E
MKRIIYTFIILFFTGVAFSQTSNDYLEVQREVLKTEKKALIAEAMQLTEEESTVFWPLYNEYNEKMYILDTKIYDLVLKFTKEYETLSDEHAIEMWKESQSIRAGLFKLEKSYLKKFQKIMNGKKVLRYFQMESKIDKLLAAQQTLEIPLAE